MGSMYVYGKLIDTMPIELFQWISVGGSSSYISFSKDIKWIIESETKFALYHAGNQVKELATLNDFYGYLTSLQSVEADIEQHSKFYGIVAKSTLEAHAYCSIFVTPHIELPQDEKRNQEAKVKGSKLLLSSVPRECRFKSSVVDDGKVAERYMPLERIEIATEQVWNSALSLKKNNAALDDFKKRWIDIDVNREQVMQFVKSHLAGAN